MSPVRFSLFLIVAMIMPVVAQEPPMLKVGSPAPKLQVGKWVQGEPVIEFERDKVYIVEFWATWCGPCRTTIPHLNKLHTKLKDRGLIVIGQDVFERDQSQVPTFIAQMGAAMTYRVALDDVSDKGRGKMAATWMEAAGQSGIPTAFVVDKHGLIAWLGHPAQLNEEVLEPILAGTFDLAKAVAAEGARTKNKTQLDRLKQKLDSSMRDKQWSDAESALAEIEQLLPNEGENLALVRFRLLVSKGDYEAASRMVESLTAAGPDKSRMELKLASALVAVQPEDPRALDLAEDLARKANETARSPANLEALARIAFMKGNKNKALGLQQQAIDLADAKLKPVLRRTLATYKEGKLPPTR